MPLQHPIRFKFAPAKARAAVHWMLRQEPACDLHTGLKACYFADKKHLNEHDRPIFGATYRAMKFGPVPLEIYDMMQGSPLYLAELDADRYPWVVHGYSLQIRDNIDPDMSVLSESDMEALEYGYRQARSMTFNERTAATHGRDWQAGRLGTMHYEDMIEDRPDKAEKVAFLREAAPYLRL
jgi:uncharacterized phage-associated protein